MNREERLGAWYREARIGLFLHWGMRAGEYDRDPFDDGTPYAYETVEAFERAAAEDGWSAERWIGTAKRLQAKYVTIATFHCDMGYLKIWPSRVPGSPCTKRDYLQELLDAADAEGIRVVVYMNRDAKHAFHHGVQWLDREAYRAYKGDPNVDITKQDGYLAYSLDVMEELLARYPRIAGFWFDGYHDKLEAQGAFARLHRLRDDLVLINNDFSLGPVADEDAMSLEDIGKVCEPSYDFASGTWVGPGDKEFAFKTKWDWFYLGEGKPDWRSYRLNYANVPSNADTVRRIVTIAGSSWNAHLGYGPKIGGGFPDVLEDFTAHFERFLWWAAESIHGTVGGGYDHGGFPPGHWGGGAYGVTTIASGGGSGTHYVHVLTPPAGGGPLTLPDAGYRVRSAVDLRTGRALAFGQSGGLLTIDVPSWEATETEGDTVIRLRTAPEPQLYPRERMTASASSELPYCPARNVLDRCCERYFRGAETNRWPQTLTLRLEEPAAVHGLCLAQPETGAVAFGGYAAPVGERIKAYEVHVSMDGERWGEPVARGELRNQRGKQVALFPPVQARHIRLTAFGNYGGTGVFQLIGVDVLI